MPIYEYRCELCEHYMEALQKVSDAPLTECPACGKAGLKKLVSASAFRLKGGGWYETDFKDRNKKNLAVEQGAGGDSGAAGGNVAAGGKESAPAPAAGGDSSGAKPAAGATS